MCKDAGYHTTYLDEIETYVAAGGRINPTQAGLWLRLGGTPVERQDLERFGVEFITTPARLRQVRARYPCPTAIDIGHGVFGAKVGLLFVDDATGRAVAYAAPAGIRSTARRWSSVRGRSLT